MRWKFGDTNVEEVKQFKYLGFHFQSSGKFNKHMESMTSIGKRRVAEVWGIGERKFKDNFLVRMQMFKSLVLPAMTYGAEITGWTEWDCLEMAQRRYLRWVLGLSRGTKKAILMEETKSIPIYIETGAAAMKYEEKISASPCDALRAYLCEVLQGCETYWSKLREMYCNRNGWSAVEINNAQRRGETVWTELKNRDVECYHQLKFNKLSICRYRFLQTDRLPWYLQRGRDISLIARFRCGNEERGELGWSKDKSCRICGWKEETVTHMKTNCCKDDRTWCALLNERGSGADWMREVIKRRNHS